MTMGCLLPFSQLAGNEPWSIPNTRHELQFPRDHGSHPDFRIEWWYLTGHLFSGERRFGFEATFFRLGQKMAVPEDANPQFGNSQFYLAHMALTDQENGRFYQEERLNRDGWDAGAKVGDLDVWNGNWSLAREGDSMVLKGSIRSDIAFTLRLTPKKRHVLFGENGISQKGANISAASYYITFPRLEATGTLSVSGEERKVTGEAWMDHEISSSQLDRNQVGWDWVSIQFFDGREIMGYILRNEDGTVSRFSRLVWIEKNGELTHYQPEQYQWIPGGNWKSEKTGAVYPISPTVKTTDPETGDEVVFTVRPIQENQEILGELGGVSYWEGACDVLDGKGKEVGRAYLELTGYSGDLGEKLR